MDKRFVIDHLINKRRKDENLAWNDEKNVIPAFFSY